MTAPGPERLTAISRDGTLLVTAPQPEDGTGRRVIVVDAVPIRRRRIDLQERLARALERFEREARNSYVTLTLRCSPAAPPAVAVDDDKLVWAVSTLVASALRHVRRGNRLRPGGSVTVDLRVDASELGITIADDGRGIPGSDAAVLRGPSSPGGEEPALALIHDIVRAHGGTIDVQTSEDAFDHGTTVSLRVPRA